MREQSLYELLQVSENADIERAIQTIGKFTTLKENFMTPKEIVMGGYQSFADGDMEGLGKIYHKDALILSLIHI